MWKRFGSGIRKYSHCLLGITGTLDFEWKSFSSFLAKKRSLMKIAFPSCFFPCLLLHKECCRFVLAWVRQLLWSYNRMIRISIQSTQLKIVHGSVCGDSGKLCTKARCLHRLFFVWFYGRQYSGHSKENGFLYSFIDETHANEALKRYRF